MGAFTYFETNRFCNRAVHDKAAKTSQHEGT